jgi:hypothetical protein
MVSKMRIETIHALLESIKHWHENYYLAEREEPITYSRESCALCRRFGKMCTILGDNFEQCPVMKATGVKSCAETPYFDVLDAELDGWPLLPPILDEISFLVDLLPNAGEHD